MRPNSAALTRLVTSSVKTRHGASALKVMRESDLTSTWSRLASTKPTEATTKIGRRSSSRMVSSRSMRSDLFYRIWARRRARAKRPAGSCRRGEDDTMRIRTRLSLAFFLISVVPLGLVTAYSYYTSAAALRRAVESQADQMAAEMGDRMAWVMTDLGDRVGAPVAHAGGLPRGGRGADPPPRSPTNSAVTELRTVATAMLAEAAPLVRRLEFESSPADRRSAGAPAPVLEATAGRTSGASAPGAAAGAGDLAATEDRQWGAREADLRRASRGSGSRGDLPGRRRRPRGGRCARRGSRHAARRDRDAGPRVKASAAAGQAAPREPVARSHQRVAARDSAAGRTRGQLARPGAVPPRPAPAPPAQPASRHRRRPAASRTRGPDRRRGGGQQAESERRRVERAEHMVALARGEALQFPVKRNGQTVGAISATVDRIG